MKAAIKIKLIVIMIFGLIISSKTVNAEVDLWPLYQSGPDSKTVLYPMYVKEGNFLMMFPFYYKTNRAKDHHILWPFIKISDGKLKRFAPFWFSGVDNRYTFFPFIKQTPDYTFWFIPPIYIKKDGSFSCFFPFYMKTDHSKFIFPCFYYANDQKGNTNFTIFPIFSRKTKARNNYKKTSFCLIAGKKTTDSSSSSWLWPLYSNRKNKDSKSFYLFPYYKKTSKKENSLSIYPFFGKKEKKKYGNHTEKSLWLLGPLFYRSETKNISGKTVEKHRRFLMFSDSLNQYGKRTFRVFGIPISERMN